MQASNDFPLYHKFLICFHYYIISGRYKSMISILDKIDRNRYFSIINRLISEIDSRVFVFIDLIHFIDFGNYGLISIDFSIDLYRKYRFRQQRERFYGKTKPLLYLSLS